jgi:SSS family solute:Na+ symporter
MHYVGLIIAVALIAGLAIYTGAKKSGKKKEGISSAVVAGLIMGTLVGGSSTVGTAQLAYNYGMSAWWFTLGGGISCLVLALVYVKPLRRQNCATLVGMVHKEYGETAGLAASILNSVGTFINILSQLLAASAVVLVVWPNMGTTWTIIIAAVFMVLYVVFGGAKGAGIVGILKLVLLYIAMVTCGILALSHIGGMDGLMTAVHSFSDELGRNFSSLFCRGFGTDFGACISLLLGVLTTQTYAQAVLSAKSDGHARAGALISTFLIPPIGIFGIIVGLYMRTVTDPTVFVAKTALTSFILDYSGMPAILAGVVLGALFIASVGTGAGLALGIATIIDREMIHKEGRQVKLSSETMGKLLIVVVLALASLLSVVIPSDTILNFAFMSMGLRGCTVFAPLCFLIWAKGKVSGKYAVMSIIGGSVVALVLGVLNLFKVIALPCDAVFPGVAVGLVIMFIGLAFRPKKLEGAARS